MVHLGLQGRQRELRVARWWLAVFLVSSPLPVWLPVWAPFLMEARPLWAKASMACAVVLAGVGLAMFYAHAAKAVQHLGQALGSPEVAGAARQALAAEATAIPLWLCALAALVLLARMLKQMGFMLSFSLFVPLAALYMLVLFLLLGPPLYWLVSYLSLLRQAAVEIVQRAAFPDAETWLPHPGPGRHLTDDR